MSDRHLGRSFGQAWRGAAAPVAAAVIHLAALGFAPWLAAGVAACGWPLSSPTVPLWAAGVVALVGALLTLPRMEQALGNRLGRPSGHHPSMHVPVLTLALTLAVLLSADASLPGLPLVIYAGLALAGEGLRRALAESNDAEQGGRCPAAEGTQLPYASWLMGGWLLLAAAGIHYVIGRELNAERLVNWSVGLLLVGTSTGLAGDLAWKAKISRRMRRWASRAAPVGLGAALIAGGIVLEKADQPPLILRGLSEPLEMRPAYAAAAAYLKQHVKPDDVVVARDLTAGLRCFGVKRGLLVDLWPGVEPARQVAAASAGRTRLFFVFPATDDQNRRAERVALEQSGDLFEQLQGLVTVEAYEVHPTIALGRPLQLDASIGPLNVFVTAHQPMVRSGAAVGVYLQVALGEQSGADLIARLVLLDKAGQQVAANDDFLLDAGGQHTSHWAPGETVEDNLLLPVAPGTPPGVYSLALGIVGPGHWDGLPLTNRAGLAGNRLVPLGEVRIERSGNWGTDPYGTLPPLGLTPAILERGGVGLLAYRPVSGPRLPGDNLQLLLHWEAKQAAPSSEPLQLQLRAGMQVIAQHAGPIGGHYPSEGWQLGEHVLERISWQIPADAPSGPAHVALSLDGATWLDLGTVSVADISRSFEAPSASYTAHAAFEEVAELVGYDVVWPDSKDGSIGLTLYWRASNARALAPRLKVFVHAVGAGDQILAQSDAEPAGGARPTTSWVAGEYIADTHWLVLPATYAGPVTWRVGLYESDRLVRVPTATGDFYVLPDAPTFP